MTREEAIDFGKMWLELQNDSKGSNTYEFFVIAIKSLEAWEKYKRGLQASIEGNKECGRYDIVLGETIALKYLDKYLKEIENDK